ncbi:MAG: hypothetical protein IAI49_13525 [Candidatus Eremiobacteraeota bacterium]|nr:hypothetical protein [Candidatus Eremiobacteraeota bacterium]
MSHSSAPLEVEVAVVHAGVTIYRLLGSENSGAWSYTTCAECATRADGMAPHAFDVRGLPNPERLDLESGDEAARMSIRRILRRSTDAGAIAPGSCDEGRYRLEFAVPFDTPGNYVRSLFALYGLPPGVAGDFFADVSFAIAEGRRDLLDSEPRLVENALDTALVGIVCDEETQRSLVAELIALLPNGRRAA